MASKKMRNCKVCGQEIAKSAKVCPYCGAKQKKSKLLIVLIILGVLVLIGALGSGGSSDSSSDKTAQTAPASGGSAAEETEAAAETVIEYKDVDVDTLISDLEDNALAASSTYRDQYLAIHGILGISTAAETISLLIR